MGSSPQGGVIGQVKVEHVAGDNHSGVALGISESEGGLPCNAEVAKEWGHDL